MIKITKRLKNKNKFNQSIYYKNKTFNNFFKFPQRIKMLIKKIIF